MNNIFKMFRYNSICLEKISEEWLKENYLKIKKSTLQKYTCVVQTHIKNSSISKISIKNINTQSIVRFSEQLLNDGLSAKTVNDVLLVVNQILKYSNEKYGEPNIKIQYVKEAKKEMRVLSLLEQNKLEIYLKEKSDIYSLAVFISLYSGLRIGELCALKWGDVQNQTICVNKTTGLTKIEDDVFNLCSSLISIIIPDSVETIGDGAFGSCESLKNLTLPCSANIGSSSDVYNLG